jgi:hypothetical protein
VSADAVADGMLRRFVAAALGAQMRGDWCGNGSRGGGEGSGSLLKAGRGGRTLPRSVVVGAGGNGSCT